MVGATLGRYAVEREIGSGGMGVVYAARDEQLGRRVAIKVLRPGSIADPSHRLRLRQEAHAASALNHPNIVTVHEIGTAGDEHFIVMELIDGIALRGVIPPGGFSTEEAVRYGVQIASAIAAAHRAGVVHRDLKPGNILMTWDGSIKIVDFGLAKGVAPAGVVPTDGVATGSGSFLGTPGYAAPEQVDGSSVDARADVFALGCILYESLTGRRAFGPSSDPDAYASALREEPVPVRKLRREVPRALETIVSKAMQKRPDARYPSAVEMLHDLQAVQTRLTARRVSLLHALARPAIFAAAVALVILLAAAAAVSWNRYRQRSWLEKTALPSAAAEMNRGENLAAFRILREAEERFPDDEHVQEMLDHASTVVSIVTVPAGADLFMRGFFEPPDQWDYLGRSPLTTRLPSGRVQRESQAFVLRAVAGGYDESRTIALAEYQALFVELKPRSETPLGMVPVPGGRRHAFDEASPVLGPFWIDRFEVRNSDYLAFVRSGGYETDAFWGDTPPELRATFVDRTGRRGPSTWEQGRPPEGTSNHPVSGVSWYEACAYCRSVGKELPTLFHWYVAAAPGETNPWARLSNFDAPATAPVGHPLRMNAFGTFDMAGNVREWTLNDPGGGQRWALGGSYREPSYTFGNNWAEPPESRAPHLGFRCARYPSAIPVAALAPVPTPFRDYRAEKPVGDEAFAIIRSLYGYEPMPLDARVDRVDDRSPDYRLEQVSFAAAYGGERVNGFLFLPKSAPPPWQTVIWYPPVGEFLAPHEFTIDGEIAWFLFLVRNGRAVFLPEFKGSFTRTIEGFPNPPAWREVMIGSAKDLRRGVDYLETRPDIDPRRIAYYSVSSGASAGVIIPAVEPRLRASVLLGGGLFFWRWPPEADPFHFASRVRVPTLMINGKHDYYFDLETSQKPLFELLGTPDKRHVVYESGHIPAERTESWRETLDWFDQHLGPVAREAGTAQPRRPV